MTQRRLSTLAIAPVLGAMAIAAAACSSSTTSPPNTNSPAASVTTTPSSASNPTVKVSDNATYGKILVDSAGKALYTYGPDSGHSGQATCTGGCLQAWPAVTVPSGTAPTAGSGVTGTIAAVMQTNGTDQVTYNGLPLYTFAADTSNGQVTGNGVNNFSVAKVTSSAGSGAGSGSGTTATTSGGGYGY